MTIEAYLELIASRLEAIVENTRPVAAQPTATIVGGTLAAPPARGPGRPKKVEAPAPVVVPEPEVTDAANDDDFLSDEPVADAKPVTKDDVRGALVKLQKATGSPEASRDVLKSFKAETLGVLKPADYAKVIAAVEKKLAPKAA